MKSKIDHGAVNLDKHCGELKYSWEKLLRRNDIHDQKRINSFNTSEAGIKFPVMARTVII